MISISINNDNAIGLGKKLSVIGLERILILEEQDPQFLAMKNLSKISDVRIVCTLALMNALVSYKLSSKGENYWMEFSKYFSIINPSINWNELPEIMLSFMKNSRGNRILIEQKYSRLKVLKNSGFLADLKEKFDYYINNLEVLRYHLAKSLNTDVNSKTIVFAIKMLYYAFRASTGRIVVLPMSIPIPIDLRIATMSYITGIINIEPPVKSLQESADLIMKNYENAQKAWNIVAQISQIPPLHIDSIIWPLLDIARKNNYNKYATLKMSEKIFSNLWKDLDKNLLSEILVTIFKNL